ncbi:MAG: zf-TFIIB domain-containing protein [Acidobacteriota bacterium]
MLCPMCKVDLLIADRQGIEIDYCPKCRGIWLDRGELDKLIERSAAPPVQMVQREEYRESYPANHGQPVHHQGHHQPHGHYRHKKHKSFLGEIFDFD